MRSSPATLELLRARQARKITPRPRRALRPGRQQWPTHLERVYQGDLRGYVADYRALILPEVEAAFREIRTDADFTLNLSPRSIGLARKELGKSARVMDALSRAHQGAQKTLHSDVSRHVIGMALKVRDWTRAQFVSSASVALGINLFVPNVWLRAAVDRFTVDNVGLIESISERLHGEVEEQVANALDGGLRWEELADALLERFEIGESRAELIARDQMGKLSGEISEATQTNLGIEDYTWRNVDDERVRPTHVEREGKVFSWDGDGLVTVDDEDFSDHLGTDGNMEVPIQPGLPIQCRCYAEPRLDALLQ